MYQLELRHAIEAPWVAMEPIRVGTVPGLLSTPGVYVTVEQDGMPLMRIDAWPAAKGPFTDVLMWRGFVVLGWGDQVHLVDPSKRQFSSFSCDGYFGHLYPLDDHLLIADASLLTCINARGELIWQSEAQGIDGVVVDEVVGDTILGQGEWDPPGGWRPFRLSLETGRFIA
jgi:hypothetical protein